MGNRSNALGQIGEQLIEIKLRQAGFEMINKLENTWRIFRMVQRGKSGWQKGKILSWMVPAKVDGDYRAIVPVTGQSVLVEVKTRAGKLEYAQLKPHQRKALTDHANLGGVSLVGWYDNGSVNSDLYLMQWPIDGFVERTSINPAKAASLHIEAIADLRQGGAE
jgi:hypothetical protein